TERLATRTVLLVAELEDEHLLEATRLGARGIVLKEMAPRLLVQCVRKVHAGEQWLEPGAAARAVDILLRREAAATKMAQVLSAREIEIVQLTIKGLANKEIAQHLSVAEGTIKTHLHHIYEKLHTRNRLELILYCQENGMV